MVSDFKVDALVIIHPTKLIRASIVLCLIFSLLSCSSVPLTSLVKLASFDESDLLNLNADEIKTRISLTSPAALQTKNVRLALLFNYKNEKIQEYQFSLKLTDSREVRRSSWWGSDERKNQYDFSLDAQSIDDFKRYQRTFLKYGKPNKYHWTVYYYLQPSEQSYEKIHLDLELQLSKNSEYIYLLKDAEIDVGT